MDSVLHQRYVCCLLIVKFAAFYIVGHQVLLVLCYVLQLGQFSVNPPRLLLEVGGTSTYQAAMPGELKSPPTWNLEVGGTSTLQA